MVLYTLISGQRLSEREGATSLFLPDQLEDEDNILACEPRRSRANPSTDTPYLLGDAQLSNELLPALFSFEHDVLDRSSADEPLQQQHRQVLVFVLRRVRHPV